MSDPNAEENQKLMGDDGDKAPAQDKKSNKSGGAKEEEKKEENKKFDPFAEEPHEPTIVSDPDTYTLTPCCCCLCACSHDRVGDATCFGCLPIRCGIMFIAIQIFLLAVILITVTFF